MGGGTVASGGTDGAGGADGSGGQSAGPKLPPITDYSARGPFMVKVEDNVGPNGIYMIVRPDPLEEDPFDDGGFLYAPLVFGPGIGQEASLHTQMLTYFASHGFVVVGTPVLEQGPREPGAAENRAKMLAALNWILAENEADGSIYKGKLYAERAVSMGYSVGGTAAVQIGGEPSVHTVVSIHGHTAEAALHGTMLQTTGTGDTVGLPLQQDTYDASMVPTFLATLGNADHGYINSAAGGNERPAIVAWMRYWIYDDQGARAFMFGDDCTMCKSPWQNPQRKNWPE
jgi:Dienelactone hydrolase family